MKFLSLKNVPSEARSIIRKRFNGFLSVNSHERRSTANIKIEDEDLLIMLHNLEIDFLSSELASKEYYLSQVSGVKDAMSFNDLLEGGWIRVSWGRVQGIGREINNAINRLPPQLAVALSKFFNNYQQTKFRISRQGSQHLEIIEQIESGITDLRDITSRSPEWVAARLWERHSEPQEKLRWWIDRWELLEFPEITPSLVWNEIDAEEFIKKAIEVLSSEASLLTWADFDQLILKQRALITGNENQFCFPMPLSSLVEQYLWLMDPRNESMTLPVLFGCRFWGLVKILLNDVDIKDQSSLPHPTAKYLFELAVDRPELMWCITENAKKRPFVLVELLLFPATTALACAIIFDWRTYVGGWDSETIETDQRSLKMKAIGDAIAIIDFYLREERIDINEIAGLLIYLYQVQTARSYNNVIIFDYAVMLEKFNNMLKVQSTEILTKLYVSIIPSDGELIFGDPTYFSALELVTINGSEKLTRSEKLVESYLKLLNSVDQFTIWQQKISAAHSLTLTKLARNSEVLWEKFLNPIDIPELMQKAASSSEFNEITSKRRIGNAIRIHLRILALAISTCQKDILDDLVAALIACIKLGVYDDDSKGRVAAFSPSYEIGLNRNFQRESIAKCLASALVVLDELRRDLLLKAILLTDEPYVLGQLITLAPLNCQEKIEQRLNALPPEEAASVWSLLEFQARRETILNAKLEPLASLYIEAESKLKTFGIIPGRAVEILRAQLHSAFNREDWTYIQTVELPKNLNQVEENESNEVILFYKALAAMRQPNADLPWAITAFDRLHKKYPKNNAYIENLIAAQISQLFSEDIFRILSGDDVRIGREILYRIENAESSYLDAGIEISSFSVNKALLLLGLSQPDYAYATLSSLSPSMMNEKLTAFQVIALQRSGHSAKAAELLEGALTSNNDLEILLAAKENIYGSDNTKFSIQIAVVDDPVPSIRNAFLKLIRMSPLQQAKVLHEEEDLPGFILEQTRLATASMNALIPMMNGLELDSCEDDLNSLLRELLTAQLSFIKWHVSDQSLGGFTARGNPGERDLIIKYDQVTLAVIEALRCDRPVTQQSMVNDLASHFQKLFSYSDCTIFIHITYSTLVEGTTNIIKCLKQIAKDSFGTLEFNGLQDLVTYGTLPVGFKAEFIRNSEHVDVYFLVLDMAQTFPRVAGKTAHDTKSNLGGALPKKIKKI